MQKRRGPFARIQVLWNDVLSGLKIWAKPGAARWWNRERCHRRPLHWWSSPASTFRRTRKVSIWVARRDYNLGLSQPKHTLRIGVKVVSFEGLSSCKPSRMACASPSMLIFACLPLLSRNSFGLVSSRVCQRHARSVSRGFTPGVMRVRASHPFQNLLAQSDWGFSTLLDETWIPLSTVYWQSQCQSNQCGNPDKIVRRWRQPVKLIVVRKRHATFSVSDVDHENVLRTGKGPSKPSSKASPFYGHFLVEWLLAESDLSLSPLLAGSVFLSWPLLGRRNPNASRKLLGLTFALNHCPPKPHCPGHNASSTIQGCRKGAKSLLCR